MRLPGWIDGYANDVRLRGLASTDAARATYFCRHCRTQTCIFPPDPFDQYPHAEWCLVPLACAVELAKP